MSRGFTLVEVMVAMAVLAIGMLVTTPIYLQAIHRSVYARKLTAAQQLGTEVLERLRAELRYDPTALSSPAIAAADRWKFDVLPHAIEPAAPSAGAACQPDGLDDGLTYHYGPFPFRREGQTFLVCYQLTRAGVQDAQGNNRIGVPANSAEARVRVLWKGLGGAWRSWSLSDLLTGGELS